MNSTKKTKENIRSSEEANSEKFQFMADSLPQIVWTTNAKGELEYLNNMGYENSGLTESQVIGQTWGPGIFEEDVERTLNIWQDCLKTGKPFETEYRLLEKRGTYRWHLARAIPQKNKKGEIKRWFGTCTDIDDFKQAQEAAKQAKEQMQAVVNNAPIILWAVDKNGIFTISEGKGLQSLRNPMNVVGMSQFELHINKYPELVKNVKKALKGKEITDENEFAGRIFQTKFAPLHNGQDEIIGMVAVSLDVTENRKAEKENLQKRQFLTNVSNEIKTSVNAILGFSNIIKKDDIPAEKREEYINHISSSAEQLLGLIGDLLDLSKLEEGKLTLINESFDLSHLINSSINAVQESAHQKGLTVELIMDDKIPESLIGDARRINQIINNLLVHAIKLTREGTIKMVASNLYTNIDEALIKFSITYTGTPAMLEKNSIGTLNFRDLKNYGETNLGISMVEQIVQLMGSELTISTPLNKKTKDRQKNTFSFSLNLKVDHAATKKRQATKPKKPAGLGREINVLVVEDVKTNQKLTEIVLNNLGCRVDFAENGEEAILILDKKKFDLIFMDLDMPVMNGYDTTRVVRNLFDKEVPIIGISDNDLQEELRSSLEAGMNDQICKPITENQLWEVINKFVIKEDFEVYNE